jgi:hypothetical protein
MKISKGPGVDGVKMKDIVKNLDILAEPIAQMVNSSIKWGCVPEI